MDFIFLERLVYRLEKSFHWLFLWSVVRGDCKRALVTDAMKVFRQHYKQELLDRGLPVRAIEKILS